MKGEDSRVDATQLLIQARQTGEAKTDELFVLLYEEIHGLASAYLRRERSSHTLQPTALVNEVYLRLIRAREIQWADRNHFMAVAASCIRRILLEHARSRAAGKRGGCFDHVTLCESHHSVESAREVDLIALDEYLTELQARSERQGRVVELRFFGGLSIEDTASALGVSVTTVKNDWRFARAWLFARLSPED